MNTCSKCHLPLTDKVSVQRGFGPDCWASVQSERQNTGQHLGGELGPFEEEVILQRDAETEEARTNIVHRKIAHSPTGFEWGYGGSGPADLALNILLYFLDETTAYRLHQDFKWEFLCKIPREGGRIPRTTIQAWIDGRLGALPFGSPTEH